MIFEPRRLKVTTDEREKFFVVRAQRLARLT
jgi:hypothetical protein